MRAVSRKRAAELRTYSKLRGPFLEANPQCQSPLECGRQSSEVHHMRGRVGADLLAVDHWAALCHGCHVYATEHPREAIEFGMSELRIGRTA